MSIYALREMLEIAPELSEHIKQASELGGFSTASKEDVLVSALKANYLVKVAGRIVDPVELQKVSMAVDLYGIRDKVEELASLITNGAMEKKASQRDILQEVSLAQTYLEAETTGFCDIEKIASTAAELYDSYEDYITSDTVRRYAGANVLVKSAALLALKARAKSAPAFSAQFEKLAQVVESCNVSALDLGQTRDLANCVVELDKIAGLRNYGFDFYKEAFFTKQAAASALMVTVAGRDIPVESLLKADLKAILGEDLGSDPYEVKAAIEALPRDSQQLVSRYVK